MLGLSFPIHGKGILAWISFIPLLLVLRKTQLSRAAAFSLISGIVFFLVTTSWTAQVGGANPLNFCLLILGNAVFFALFGLGLDISIRLLSIPFILAVPVVWTLMEFFRTHIGFLSWPWGVIGYSQYKYVSMNTIASFTGVYGVSFMIMLFNACLTEITYRAVKRRTGTYKHLVHNYRLRYPSLIIFLTILLITTISVFGKKGQVIGTNRDALTISVVQGNKYWNGDDHVDFNTFKEIVRKTYSQLTLIASKDEPDLIIWPSTSIMGHISNDPMTRRYLSHLAKEANAFLLVGTSGRGKVRESSPNSRNNYANSAYLFAPDGSIIERYHKIKLLPFNEYLPARNVIPWPRSIVGPDWTDHVAGQDLTVFKIKGYRFGVQICSENMYPDQFRKLSTKNLDFMVSMTNDGFTNSPSARHQFLSMNVLRAAENRMPVVRASTTGISCFIDPLGRIIGKVADELGTDINVSGHLTKNVSFFDSRSFYTRKGDWFIKAIAGMLFIAGILQAYRKRKK